MGGDAKRFYLETVFAHEQTFNHAVELIGHEYNSSMRPNRTENVLNTLRPHDELCENQDERKTLAMVYKPNTTLAPQAPTSHRRNAHKIEFLRNTVVRFGYATEPLSRIASHNLSF